MENLIRNTVKEALDELELRYRNVDDETFFLTMCCKEADFKIRLTADDEQEVLCIIGYFPVKVPESRLEAMYKVINDINYKLLVGSFAIDSDDGELIFQVVNNADGGAINNEVVKVCFKQTIMALKKYYGNIMKGMYGGEQYTFTFGDSEKRESA